MQTQSEQILRSTFGYTTLRSHSDAASQSRAQDLLDITNAYASRIAKNMGSLALADSTGFDPEGVIRAISGLQGLENSLTQKDWRPQTLFGSGSGLSHLVGIMMQLPSLNSALNDIAGSGQDRHRIADIAKAWVSGRPLREIATNYFEGDSSTAQITEACKGIYRALVNSGVWGLAALSRLPGSGIDWESLPETERRRLNLLPAFLYHGVDTEEAVLMRMNQVPRSIAKRLGERLKRESGDTTTLSIGDARAYIRNLSADDWHRARPSKATLDGSQYREIWQRLSGEVD